MKKNGKKYRKIQKEKQANDEIIKERKGEPFSRVSKKKQICYHCRNIVIPGGIPDSYMYKFGIPIPVCSPIYSTSSTNISFFLRLQKISDTEYECLDCKKRFSVEKVERINWLKESLEHKQLIFLRMEQVYACLSKAGLKPTEYYQISEYEVKYID